MISKINTHSGCHFDFTDPQPEQIEIADIAHALGHICRFGGHGDRFYSVAEHSVNCALLAIEHCYDDTNTQMATLLHDAQEAYVGDIPSPFKALLPDFRAFEDLAQRAIGDKFLLYHYDHTQIKCYDMIMLHVEYAELFTNTDKHYPMDELEPHTRAVQQQLTMPTLQFWDPPTATLHFYQLYHQLTNARRRYQY